MKAEDNLYPYVTLEESAADGSAVATPDAGFRRIFAGDDDAMHDKNSSGTVGDLGGAGGGGATASEALSAADVALGTGSWSDIVSISLAAGDYSLSWKALFSGGAAAITAFFRITDGTNVWDEGEAAGGSSGFRYSCFGVAKFTLGSTTTVKLQARRSSDATVSVLRDGGMSAAHHPTKLHALKIG